MEEHSAPKLDSHRLSQNGINRHAIDTKLSRVTASSPGRSPPSPASMAKRCTAKAVDRQKFHSAIALRHPFKFHRKDVVQY